MWTFYILLLEKQKRNTVKAFQPPVLSIPSEDLMQKLLSLTRYKNIKIEAGKIVVASQKDVSNILKMLNDDFLRSDLSDKEYDSPAKKILPEI